MVGLLLECIPWYYPGTAIQITLSRNSSLYEKLQSRCEVKLPTERGSTKL
jgi:hypothetical protein